MKYHVQHDPAPHDARGSGRRGVAPIHAPFTLLGPGAGRRPMRKAWGGNRYAIRSLKRIRAVFWNSGGSVSVPDALDPGVDPGRQLRGGGIATRLGEPVRAERRLRCPVCLASIAHRGPCAVTCGRSCAMRLHRARRRIRLASSAPLLCPVSGSPPRPGLGLVSLSGTEDVGELAFACGLCLTSIVGRMMEPAEA